MFIVQIIGPSGFQKENVNKANAKPAVQGSKTATNPGLFSEEAKLAASRLESLLTNLDQSLSQHLQKVRASAKASQALSQYNAAVKSAEGSKCVPLGGESRLELVLETCVSSVLQVTKEELRKSISAAVEKVKDLDYNLRLTSDLCSSLKEPPSEVCEEAKRKSLDSLGNVVSQLEIERLGDLAIRDVESCVDEQAGHLISLTKQINDCRADGQEL